MKLTRVFRTNFYLATTILSIALFFAATVFISFPFIYDDYNFLNQSYRPDFGPDVFTNFVARMPISISIDVLFYKYHLWEKSYAFLYLFYAFQAAGFVAILKWLRRSLPSGSPTDSSGLLLYSFFLSLLCFHPNLYEIQYWTSAMPYTLGFSLIAAALFAPHLFLSALFFAAATACSEMFLLAAVTILLVPIFLLRRKTVRQMTPQFAAWGLSLFIYGAVRVTLGRYFHTRPFNLSLDPINMLKQFGFYLRMVFDVQFFRLNWVATILDWVALATLLSTLLRNKLVRPSMIVIAFLLITFSSANNFILNYEAARAYYATILIKGILIALLAAPLFLEAQFKFQRRVVVAFFTLSCLSGNAVVLYTKQANSVVMRQKEKQWADRMHGCVAPCVIEVTDLSEGLRGDRTLPREVWKYYLGWLKERFEPQKQIEFKFLDGEN